MARNRGRICVYCQSHTFRTICTSCGRTHEEAEAALMDDLNEQEPHHGQ